MEIIDLSYGIEEGMLTYPTPRHPITQITQLGRIPVEGRETREIRFGTHTGTHVDAPKHFVKGGKGVDELCLETLIGPVTILDFSHLEEGTSVMLSMLRDIEITPRMLFKFGWGKYWPSKEFYNKDYPTLSKDAASYLVEKGVKLLAHDTASVDPVFRDRHGEEDSPVHKILLPNGVILVEYVANLDMVTDYNGWNIAALPLKITGADGSPARVILFR